MRSSWRSRDHVMYVAELWRYPVKSMAGEALTSATIRRDGIVGDRAVYVLGPQGRIVTARTRPRGTGSLLILDVRPVRLRRLPRTRRHQSASSPDQCGDHRRVRP